MHDENPSQSSGEENSAVPTFPTVPPRPIPPPNSNHVDGFTRFLYTQNPFYLISACLVLYGLHLSFGNGSTDFSDPWSLASALCGYTFLMAITAVALIRFGKVWDDVRSILLILLLLFFAISASFDEVCRTDFVAATRVLVCGLAFSVLVSEGLFLCLGMRFPLLFRVPYYLLLALLFVYPIVLSQPDASNEVIAWRIFLFPVIAGVAALTLIPAIRCGHRYVEQNGTPWRWPLYPWSVFFVLGVGVCIRAFGMSLSFDPAPERALYGAFGVFYLVPFLFAVLLLLVEIGVVEKLESMKKFAMRAAPILIVLAMPLGQNKAFTGFLDEFARTAGSPVYLTWIGLLVFYVYCLARGLRGAESWLCTALVPAMFIDHHTFGLATLAPLQWWPLAVIGGVQLARALERREPRRCFWSIVLLSVALTISFWNTPWQAPVVVAMYHIVLIAALLISCVANKLAGEELRVIAALLIGLPGLNVLIGSPFFTVPPLAYASYIAVLIVVTFTFWKGWAEIWWLAASAWNAIALVVVCIGMSRDSLQELVNSRGFYPLAFGLLFFLVAGLISAQKCGMLKPIWDRVYRLLFDLRHETESSES